MTGKNLLSVVDVLLRSVPQHCKEEVRTAILVLGVELIKKKKDDNYIFISLQNKKYEVLRYAKVRKNIISAEPYEDFQFYDLTLFDVKSKKYHTAEEYGVIADDDMRFVKEKYEVLFTAFVNMNRVRQRFIYTLLKEHWRITRIDPRNKVILTDVIDKCGINRRTGFTLWKKIRQSILKIYNEGRVNYLDRIQDFETLYHLIVGKGGKINTETRKW